MSMIIINKYYILPIENGRYMIRWYRKLSSMDIRFLISFHYKYDLLSYHLFYYFKCFKCLMVRSYDVLLLFIDIFSRFFSHSIEEI